MNTRAREDILRFFRRWALGLLVLLGAGVGGNLVLAQRVQVWRDRNPALHWAAADRLIREKEYVQARIELQRALELAPNHFEPYFVSGHLYYALQDWEKALEMYRRAEQMRPDSLPLRERIFWSLMSLGRHLDAAEYGSDALRKGQASPTLRRYVAEAWIKAEGPDKAIPYFEAALAASPQNTDIMNRLEAAYRQAGRHDEAEAMLRRMAEVESTMLALPGHEPGE